MWKLTVAIVVAAGLAICQQPDEKTYKVGNGVTPPKVLQKIDPAYTKEANDAKISGAVLLSLVVGSDGVARDIQVMRSLDAGLDANAIAAVQQWKFQPGTKDGEAVSVKATIEVNFRLK
jgi:TonB family protein